METLTGIGKEDRKRLSEIFRETKGHYLGHGCCGHPEGQFDRCSKDAFPLGKERLAFPRDAGACMYVCPLNPVPPIFPWKIHGLSLSDYFHPAISAGGVLPNIGTSQNRFSAPSLSLQLRSPEIAPLSSREQALCSARYLRKRFLEQSRFGKGR